MFSTAQLDMINGFVAPMRDEGYVYYVAYSDNNRSSSSDPDLYIYFSQEEIFAPDLMRYDIPNNSKLYSIRTSNAGSYGSTSGPRVDVSDVAVGRIIEVDEVEFVSTNATFTEISVVQPDYTVGEVGQYEMQGAMLFVVCTFLLFFAWTKFFRR